MKAGKGTAETLRRIIAIFQRRVDYPKVRRCKFAAGQMDAAEMADLESKCCPGCGSCAGLFTANTMNSLTEVLGMGLPGNGTIPAAYTGARRLLAKRACARDLNSVNPDPRYAAFEKELLEMVNKTGIGPQGLGGRTTALAVHVEWAPTHIASLPVAVNINCHAARHAQAVL